MRSIRSCRASIARKASAAWQACGIVSLSLLKHVQAYFNGLRQLVEGLVSAKEALLLRSRAALTFLSSCPFGLRHRGCPGAAHGHWSLHMTKTVSGGQATGKIYDCDAGFSNWLQGWSDSKKSWCCAKKSRGCVKHHCFTGDISTWGQDKRDWCCSNHQRGCAHTTLSPLGCDAVCVLHGAACYDSLRPAAPRTPPHASPACIG